MAPSSVLTLKRLGLPTDSVSAVVLDACYPHRLLLAGTQDYSLLFWRLQLAAPRLTEPLPCRCWPFHAHPTQQAATLHWTMLLAVYTPACSSHAENQETHLTKCALHLLCMCNAVQAAFMQHAVSLHQCRHAAGLTASSSLAAVIADGASST